MLVNKVRLPPTKSKLHPSKMAGLLRLKNEDYWVEVILRTICKELEEVVIIDTGSTDKTICIVRQMQKEGLSIRLIQHSEPPHLFNLITNLVLERVICGEYHYLIDGDELQLQPSLAKCKNTINSLDSERVWHIAHHHLFVHPVTFTRCTKPFCTGVQYRAGRVLNRRKLRMSEIMINDGTERISGLPFLSRDPWSIFMRDVFTLHCPLSQRSTISSWKGNAEINPDYAGQYRMKRYLAASDDYISIPFFPKEIKECKYSDHNHYIPLILESGIPLI